MKIFFGQIYTQPGITFPFTHHFQKLLADEVSKRVPLSIEFKNRYGSDWDIMLRISAKRGLSENELRGPTEFKKDKDVEFTIFLPYDVIIAQKDWYSSAVESLLNGACSAFEHLSLSSCKLRQQKKEIVEIICSTDPNLCLRR